MSRILTTDKLIESVRRRAMIPDDTQAFTDDDIIDIMNEEMDEQVIADVLVTNEEHLVHNTIIPIEADKDSYKIPYRSVGNKLRDIAFLTSSGAVYESTRVSLEEISDYRNDYSNFESNAFYVQGDSIKLVTSRITDFSSLSFYYYIRPNVLVKEAETGKISNIDRNTGVITVSSFPTTFNSLPIMDLVAYRTPNTILKFDIQPISINSATKTITYNISDIPKDLIVGDYVCLAEQSPVPNIPTEFHPILAQATAVHILESMGDTEGLTNAIAKLEKMKKSIIQITNDRVEGAPQKINPRNSTLVQTLSHGFRKRRGL